MGAGAEDGGLEETEGQLSRKQQLSSTHFRLLKVLLEPETGRLMLLELATGRLAGETAPSPPSPICECKVSEPARRASAHEARTHDEPRTMGVARFLRLGFLRGGGYERETLVLERDERAELELDSPNSRVGASWTTKEHERSLLTVSRPLWPIWKRMTC